VRHALREGKLEVVSKAEYDEVQEHHKSVAKVPTHQEAQLQGAALKANRALIESRGLDEEEDDDTEDWAQARLDEIEDETDDPEEQVVRNPKRATPKVKSGKKKSGKGKKAKSGEEPTE
jgi:hypothetical protein